MKKGTYIIHFSNMFVILPEGCKNTCAVKPLLETTFIKQSTALGDHCSDIQHRPFLNQPKRTCMYRPLGLRDHFKKFSWVVSEYRLYCIWLSILIEFGWIYVIVTLKILKISYARAKASDLNKDVKNCGMKIYNGTQNYFSLPIDRFLDLYKLNAFADDKIILREQLKVVLGSMENIVGKGENAG